MTARIGIKIVSIALAGAILWVLLSWLLFGPNPGRVYSDLICGLIGGTAGGIFGVYLQNRDEPAVRHSDEHSPNQS